MTGQLNQLTNNSRPSNELSDDDEPDLQQILIEEARQRWLNQKSLLKLKQAKLPNLKQSLVYQRNSINDIQTLLVIPIQPLCWILMKYMACTYYFSNLVWYNFLTDKVKPIHSITWLNAYDSIWKSSPKLKDLHGIK